VVQTGLGRAGSTNHCPTRNSAIKLKEVLEGFIEKQRKDNNMTAASC
jgi:hypothetical protein